MYLFNIINCDYHSCRSAVVSQENDRPLDRIDLAHAARVLLIRAAGLACIGSEVENCDFRVLSGAYDLVNEGQLLIQQNFRFFTETWGIDRKRVEKRNMKD